jgi:lipopolysaccharide/colanic/teichoic acid biosynthesis glycosyltransferase
MTPSPRPLDLLAVAPVQRFPLKIRRLPSQRRAGPLPQVLGEELFRHALARERKLADRLEESFALVLVSLDNGASRWSAVIEALHDQRLDTDLLGWYLQDGTLGLIRQLGHENPAQAATSLATTVLARCLSLNSSLGCSIRVEVYSPFGESVPAVLLEPQDEAIEARKRLQRVAKRALDIVGSLSFITVMSPLYLLVAASVKATSKGPVFFRQQRIGEGGRPFLMLKFRTMCTGADESVHKQYVTQFIQKSEAAATDSGLYKIVNDPRVTPVGHFLRRASLDELPQFWNVLKGEMSLVGPRPPLAYEVENYKRWHRRRVLEAKPGITGLWQVTGRSRTTFEEMVRLDLRYAKAPSVWTDVKILLATPRAVVTGKGAH